MKAANMGFSAYWVQQSINGLVLASLYATLATAYALLQGITNRIILSFGDFATFGAFTAIYVAIWTLLDGEEGFAVLGIALLVSMIAAAGLGRVTHSIVFGPLIRSPNQAVMIASIGLSIILQEVIRLQSDARDQWLPPLFDDGMMLIDGPFTVKLGWVQAAVVLTSAGLLATLLLLMRYSALGRLWRSVAQNARLAQLCGVNTRSVFQGSFMAAGLFAGAAGWMVAISYGGVSFAMGLVLGFKAMFAAIIGGFGSISGAIIGGVCLAFIETVWTAALPMDYRDVAVFSIIIAILVLRPEGFMGNAQRRESEE